MVESAGADLFCQFICHPQQTPRLRKTLDFLRVGEGTRTPDNQIHSLELPHSKEHSTNDLPPDQKLRRCEERRTHEPDLASTIDAQLRQAGLPDAIRAAIVDLIRAASIILEGRA